MRRSYDNEEDYRQGRDDYRHNNIDHFRDKQFGSDSADRAYYEGVRAEERRDEERRDEIRMEEEEEYRRAERAAENSRMEEEQMYEAYEAYERYAQEQQEPPLHEDFSYEDDSKESTRANILTELTFRIQELPVMFKENNSDKDWSMTQFTYDQFIGNMNRCKDLIKTLYELDSE